ncbi:MAG: ribonuclease H-like domain-containing protein [Planctomycetota bacterium]|nr:MAG: ribonuclease H-like domain-containing protein [Planctomycetota bacterium]
MKRRVYLDIETTGLSPRYSDLTVIGLALEEGKSCSVLQLVGKKLAVAKRLRNINGPLAVDLWYNYQYRQQKQSLAVLLEYNRQNVLNLSILKRKLRA